MRIHEAVCSSSASCLETSTKPARSQARTAPSFQAYGSTVTPFATALVDQVLGHGARRVRAEAASACCRDQEHVEAFWMDLEVADRLARFLDNPRLHVRAREPLLHLSAGERLVVPVARDLGIRVPGDQAIDVADP